MIRLSLVSMTIYAHLTTSYLHLDCHLTSKSEMDNFAANISLKQEAIRTKLEKHRVTKIQTFLHPGAEEPGSSKDTRPPKRKRQTKEEAKERERIQR